MTITNSYQRLLFRSDETVCNTVQDCGYLTGLGCSAEGVDAVVVFAGHRQYYSLYPRQLQELCGQTHPVIVDGRNVVEPNAFIDAGFVYKGIGRGDKNGHSIR